MPEEKYGDIDVNPIETRIDTKIDSTKHSDLNHDSNFAQAIETASALISEQPESDTESDNVVSETVVVEDVVEPTVPMSTIPEEETNIDPSVSVLEDSADENTSVSVSEDSTDETTSVSMPTPETPKSKKKKLPLVVFGATLATLVVGGAAFAFYYNMPEKVAADAITGLIKQGSQQLETKGNLEISPQADSELYQYVSSLRIDFATNTDNFKRSAEFDFGLKLRDYGYLHLKLNSFLDDNGTAYLNIENLAETYKKAAKALGLEQDDAKLNAVVDAFASTFNKIDGVWWRIDLNEILDSFDNTDYEIDKKEKQDLKTAYRCVINEMKQELSQTDRFTKAYLDAPFIKLTSTNYDDIAEESFKGKIKDYGTLYKVSLDAKQLFEFTKKHQELVKNSKIVNCLQGLSKNVKSDTQVDSTEGFSKKGEDEDNDSEEFTQGDAQRIVDHLKDLYLGVDFFTHQLKGVYLQVSESKIDFTGIINFKYQNSKPVAAPSGPTSLGDLIRLLIPTKETEVLPDPSVVEFEKIFQTFKNTQSPLSPNDTLKLNQLKGIDPKA